MTAKWIMDEMEKWSPIAWAEQWDNVGLLVGDPNDSAKRVLVALDVTQEVLDEAISGKYDFIISHHPVIYKPLQKIVASDPTGRKILTLIKNGIGCYSAHTNLDKAPQGVNDCLAEKLGGMNTGPLIEEDGVGLGRVWELPGIMPLAKLASYVKITLNLPEIRYAGDNDIPIKKVGICCGDGSGADYMKAAKDKKCDVYITGDLRYHTIQYGLELGLCLLDISHYGGEVFVVDTIVKRLRDASSSSADSIEIHPSKAMCQVFKSM